MYMFNIKCYIMFNIFYPFNKSVFYIVHVFNKYVFYFMFCLVFKLGKIFPSLLKNIVPIIANKFATNNFLNGAMNVLGIQFIK
jgi:hypothetical protein